MSAPTLDGPTWPEQTPVERVSWRVLWVVISLVFFWFVVRPILAPVVLAMLTAVVFYPVHRRVESVLGQATFLSAMVSMTCLAGLIGGPLGGIIVLGVIQANEVAQELLGEQVDRSRLVDFVERALDSVSHLVEPVVGDQIDVRALVRDALQSFGTFLYEHLPDAVGMVGRLTFSFLITCLVLFFLFLRGARVLNLTVELMPITSSYTRQLLYRLEKTIQGVFLGAILTAVFQGTLGCLGFWLTGFENFVIWGALVAGASFIPFVGTGLIWFPAVFYLYMSDHYANALVMLLFGIVISTVDNFLRALFIYDRSTLHPLMIFLALLGGVQTMGPMGLIYGPLLLACLTEMVRIHRGDAHPPEATPVSTPAVTVPDAPAVSKTAVSKTEHQRRQHRRRR
ncbi:MAG: AI-2E family transporter [Thermoanaerobaculia bacterium]|nr:AI-2E family transporter [Thermoanaerobaculia bacterium]